MEKLAQRYAYATQIPRSAFTIIDLNRTFGPAMYQVSGKMSDLPDTFMAVDIWDVADGVWRDWINEERLALSESIQDRIPGEKLVKKPCNCSCCQGHNAH